ncbi:pirin family protein [Dethiosulfatarculus sandiegensis]|uniref:Pirin n=1 Tax=Dethiosulfatarculus sandiegensis TaxID=1429043 RepID=A0A0D2JI12_9BACT|nr:pirin family protein [Dethiosulfatarculus sandiegensis]KIX15361.1 pirin [Dethiosulfatarculus sandiegensis]
MPKIREIKAAFQSQPTREGAGVLLRRGFGQAQVPLFDPFLMLDHFQSDNPGDYAPGFPWHPHRGIETITYMLAGQVEHKDSLGNQGVIKPGEVQWMTAGSGIIHQEMPIVQKDTPFLGFQIWANLPRSHKMTSPRYREVKAKEIPALTQPNQAEIKVIAGNLSGTRGPVREVIIEPIILDITLPSLEELELPIKRGLKAVIYIFQGQGAVGDIAKGGAFMDSGSVVLLDDGEILEMRAGGQTMRALLLAGRPIVEPVCWRGPIVMNTEEELDLAFREYKNGTFLK